MFSDSRKTHYNNLNFTHEHFNKLHLAHKTFQHCNFNYCRFEEAQFEDCNFYQCSFNDCFLSLSTSDNLYQSCGFYHTSWQGAQKNLKLLKCRFLQTDFALSDCDNCHFFDLDLREMQLPWERIHNSTFDQCKLNKIDAKENVLNKITFSRSEIGDSHFTKAQFKETSFSECVLHECDFTGLNADQLQCVNSTLHQVNFNDAKVNQGSIFMGSRLHKVDFSHAQLNASTFADSIWEQVLFTGTMTTSFNIDHAQLNKVNFQKAELLHPSHNFTQFKDITWHNKAQEQELTALSEEEKALKKFNKIS